MSKIKNVLPTMEEIDDILDGLLEDGLPDIESDFKPNQEQSIEEQSIEFETDCSNDVIEKHEPEFESDYFISQESINKAKETLNQEQAEAFDRMVNYIESEEEDSNYKYMVLVGYAGTGKTYMLSKLIQACHCNVVMTAPTNKAVKILSEYKGEMNDKVQFATIHKILALTMKWIRPKKDEDFKPYQKLVRAYNGKPSLSNYNILIVDEVSMLGDDLFEAIDMEKTSKTKIIFMGDPAQIPPVKMGNPAQIPPVNAQDSIPLLEKGRRDHNIGLVELKRVMRQAEGNKILQTAYQIRNNRFSSGDPILNRVSNNDVIFYSSNSSEDIYNFKKDIIKKFVSEDFKNNPNHCKLIAWRNVTVNTFNDFIRSSIFQTPINELEPFIPGEKLIADRPIFGEDGRTIILNTSDEMEIVSCIEKELNYVMPSSKGKSGGIQMSFNNLVIESTEKKGILLKYYTALVKIYDRVEESSYEANIDIINPESGDQLNKWILGGLIKIRDFDEYERMSVRFAQVKYNYAITAHKSQGSTYDHVFIIEDDINENKNLLERNRIKYTSCTRPKLTLSVLSKRNRPIKEQGV